MADLINISEITMTMPPLNSCTMALQHCKTPVALLRNVLELSYMADDRTT